MRVFVLSTGRCGSMTFAKACSHITNYTSGHETRAGMIGPERLRYPDRHIEVDNRLSWFLGQMPIDGTAYVHLKRDPEAVAQSYSKRWFSGGIMPAFAKGITMGPEIHEDIDLCRWYVETVNANIEAFINYAHARGSITEPTYGPIDIDDPKGDFALFWDILHAEGDFEAALAEFDVRHNAS